ncbi:MAG: NADH-quinone oxidoreductase subunit M [Archangiaceae bacterium]|nr:NADH-quinone oxidoreductase subunit M [Archangiaceae bacterium]
MSSYDSRLLNFVIFAPLVFAAVLFILPKNEKGQIRALTFIAMLVDAALAIWAYVRFAEGPAEFRLEYWASWVPEIGLSYHVGIDGIAASLVLLTGILGPLVVLASWTFVQDKVKEFHLAILILQTAMMGALCSLDLLLFYIFFEAMLIPMYLLIGVWGSEERQMAAMKFFLYTLVGSLLMLVALLGVYFIATPAGQHSFDYAAVYNGLLGGSREVAACVKAGGENCSLSPVAAALMRYGPWMFGAFALAFAIKVPMWPVHTWLPDAHTQAPVAGSMILAAVMLKMGTFGFWRFAVPLFPAAAQKYQLALATLAVIGIVYGALMCLAQRDIKRLIAYSSVSHLGYCMLGLAAMTPEAATGSAYQMLNHGVSTGALFLLFGMIYERRHVRLLSDYGGLAKVMPIFTAFFVIVTFSSVAVPGTNGFIGEFLVLLGTFNSKLPLWVGVLASLGVVLGAAYMLLMVQKVFFGPVTRKENQQLHDLNLREIATTVPFLILIVVMGLRPQPLLTVIEQSTRRYVARATLGPESSEPQLQVKTRPPPTPAPAPAGAIPSLKLGENEAPKPSPARDRLLRPMISPNSPRPVLMAAPPANAQGAH